MLDYVEKSINRVNLPGYNDTKFLLMKPEFTSVVYIYADGIGNEIIRHYDLIESRVIHDYPHNCSGNSYPILLEQFSNGSKIFYQCSNTYKVYIKTLGNSAAEDQLRFTLQRLFNTLISPDDSKLILYNCDINYLILIDLDATGNLSNAKRITFNVDPRTFESFAFSKDGKMLYAISTSDSTHRLFEIDFQDLSNVIASGLPSYHIGRGRRIRVYRSRQFSSLPSSTQLSSSIISSGPRFASGLNLLLFDHKSKIQAINLSDPELISQMVMWSDSSSAYRYHLSFDNERIYFKKGTFYFYDFTSGDLIRLNLPDHNDKNVLLIKQPGPDNIVYIKKHRNDTCTIHHYNLAESRVIFDYGHNCQESETPLLLDQFSNGSKILYQCEDSNGIYLKTLDNTNGQDVELFKVDRYYDMLLSPDNSKLILYHRGNRYWLVKELHGSDTKVIYFNVDAGTFKSISFARDDMSLYVISSTGTKDPEYKLFIVDFRKILENDYSKEHAPYNLGQGYLITIS